MRLMTIFNLMIYLKILKKQPRALLKRHFRLITFIILKKLNNTQKDYLAKDFRESYDKNILSHFGDCVIFTSELSSHYAGFPSFDVLNVVFEYLDPGINDDITIGSNYLKPFRG